MFLNPELNIEVLSDMGANQGPFLETIQHHDNMMARALMANWMDLGFGTNSGATAIGERHYEIFLTTLESRMRDISQVWQEQIIPDLVDVNLGSGNYPILEFDPLTFEHRELIKEVFMGLAISREPHASEEFMQQMEL